MNARECETQLLQILDQPIRNYCKWRWTSIEMDDRVAEAKYVFLIVLRTKGLPEEAIWPVFQQTLHKYMKPINARESRHRYCRSLNARIKTRSGELGCTLLDLLPCPQPDVSDLAVDAAQSHHQRFFP